MSRPPHRRREQGGLSAPWPGSGVGLPPPISPDPAAARPEPLPCAARSQRRPDVSWSPAASTGYHTADTEPGRRRRPGEANPVPPNNTCLLYTSDAADEE